MPTEKSPRECGECAACCTILGVEKLGKLPGQECLEIMRTPNGMCGIHPERPEECKTFLCEWMQETTLFGEKDRPDRCGVMVAGGAAASSFSRETGVPLTVAHEAFPGAFDMYHGNRVLKKLAKKTAIVLVTYGTLTTDASRRMIGPPKYIPLVRRWLTQSFK